MSKLAYLSILIAIVAIPTMASRRGISKGPRIAVSAYCVGCVTYYGLLRVVIPRLG